MLTTEAVSRVTSGGGTLNVPDKRVVKKITIGQAVRQGDIYLHRVEDDHPRGDESENKQLAVGATRGSRHLAVGANCFEPQAVPSWVDANQPLGPLIVAQDSFTVTHPEHAHCELPRGTYQVTHQMDPRTRQRVED